MWVSDEWGRVEATSNADKNNAHSHSAQTLDVGALVAKTKADLAASLGIPTENIDLSIRF